MRNDRGQFIKGDTTLGGWNKGKKGYTNSGSFKKGQPAWNKGLKGSVKANEGSFKVGDTRGVNTQYKNGETYADKNINWKGDDVGYFALHDWIRRELGTPNVCQDCKIVHNRCHWHNISKQYKRDLSDWIRLCPKCHKKAEKEL